MTEEVHVTQEIQLKITTIIRTLCEASRRTQILRAIASIQAASIDPVRIVVVVNGDRFDSDLVELLQGRPDVDVVQITEGSVTKAQLAGRRAVTSDYFSFLDDDDEYLPGALDLRLALLEATPDAALSVTNGYRFLDNTDRVLYSRMDKVSERPLFEIFQQIWLNSCNHLFRSSDLPIGYFEDAPPYMEWTWLAFRLAMTGKKVAASTEVTFRYNDTPGSLSKTAKYHASRVTVYNHMLAMQPPPDIADIIRRRRSSAWHDIASAELEAGATSKAIAAHVNSMTSHWSGIKFATYSRYIVAPGIFKPR